MSLSDFNYDTLLKYFTAFEQIFFALFHQGEI